MKSPKYTDDTRIALLEQSINHINETLKSIEKRFDKLDNKLDNLEKKVDNGFNEVNKKFDLINNRIWSNFFWVISATTTITFFLLKYSPHFIK